MAPAPKAKRASASSAVAPASGTRTINWPLLRTLVPAEHLELDHALPGQIVTIRNLWPAKLCKDYVSFLASLPLTTTPGRPKRGDAVRVNDRFQIDDPAFAERLWRETGLKTLVLGGSGDDGDTTLSDGELRELWGGEVVSNASLRSSTCRC